MFSTEACENFLKKKLCVDEVSVQEIKLINVPRDGFLGEYYSLLVDYLNTADGKIVREKLFVKTLPFHNAIKTERALEVGFFKKEADCYSEIFSKMSKYSGELWAR